MMTERFGLLAVLAASMVLLLTGPTLLAQRRGGAATSAGSQLWWERPWDYKVAPRLATSPGIPGLVNERGEPGPAAWYLDSVNDLGGTPEKDNQRDISKALGRVRKFNLQTLYRLNELRDISELAELGKGPMAEAAGKAQPLFDQAAPLLQQAVELQKAGKTPDARAKVDQALKLIAEGEAIAETAIAVRQEELHLQHLRNAIAYAGSPELAGEIDALAKAAPAEAAGRVADLAKACREQAELIKQLRAKAAALKAPAQQVSEVQRMLDLYDYLLACVVKDGPRDEQYDGLPIKRDAAVSDLKLNAVSTVARRVGQLRGRLRGASNRISALAGEPATNSLSDRLSAKLKAPIDDLDTFTRSKFGIVRSLRLADNNPWDWEFNYTPPNADAVSVSGWWQFQIDPKFDGVEQGWQKADFDAKGWKTLYAPNAWERQGVNDWNPIDSFKDSYLRVMGRELPFPEGRGYENAPEHRQYNGVAWYRKTVFIPKEWEGSAVELRCTGTGGQFQVWANGQSDGQWQGGRNIRLPRAGVKFGAPNVLAIACFNDNRDGGFTEGNLWLVRGQKLREEDMTPPPVAEFRLTPLPGGWANEETFSTPGGKVRFNTVLSSASPGCLLATDARQLNLWGWSMKGYASPVEAAYMAKAGVQRVKLGESKPIAAGADLSANWLLLMPPPSEAGRTLPLLVVFEHRPKTIAWRQEPLREGLVADFDGPVGQVGLIRIGQAADPAETLLQRAATWSRAMLAYPEHASEFWTVDPAKKLLAFEVAGSFHLLYNYHLIKDDWNTQPLQVAGLPPLACYALDYKYPGVVEGAWEKTGLPVKYQQYARGQFRAKMDGGRIDYATPTGDQATLWKGIGTLFQEVWGPAAKITRQWGSNNDRAGFAFHQDWHTYLVEGFALKVHPPENPEWEELDRTVKLHQDNGLFMFMLDFSNDQERDPRSVYYPHSGGYLRTIPEAMPTLAEFWKAVATRYKNVPADLLGYNFNNEPCTIDVETYNKLIRALTAGVRSVDKDKWITLDFGDGWANSDFVFATEPTGDAKTAYNYHLYYKHDGIIEGRSPELFFPQYNPAQPMQWNNSEDMFIHRIEDTFVYQTVHHVPVWCGEFGGSINNPNQEMLIWLEDYISTMERMGHGWSWWNFNGNAYGRTGLMEGAEVSPSVLVLKRFMHRKGSF